MISWLDSIVGRTLYPIIVKLCHWFDWNQYQVYRYTYVLSSMLIFIMVWETSNWFFIAYTGFWMFIFILSAIVFDGQPPKENPRSNTASWRIIFVAFSIIVTVLFFIKLDHGSLNIAVYLIMLGEYARAIDTIPPRKRKAKMVHATV